MRRFRVLSRSRAAVAIIGVLGSLAAGDAGAQSPGAQVSHEPGGRTPDAPAEGRTPERLSSLDLATFKGITLDDFELPSQCFAAEGDLGSGADGSAGGDLAEAGGAAVTDENGFFDASQLASIQMPNLASLTPYRLSAGQRALRPEWRVAPIARGVTTTARSTGTIALPGIPQPSERALGVSVGAGGNITFSTEVASDSGAWRQDDARWGWTLQRQAAETARGFVWGGTAAGRIDAQGGRNQDMDLRLGYRRGSSDGDWMLTPQVVVSSSYQPAASDRWGATVKPGVAAVARVFGSDKDWVSAKVDTRVGYSIPVAANATGHLDASAMLRLTFRGLQ
ncbi:hypothetical protein [Chelatococcus asaccharovorans]|uniref:Transporter n=1 Tax=Chelatococcus asaccharovorans TaxID=28210 RepID=A0A2V3U0L8_9HYPH|nr:hypothetical protein [Chelatococcus asaccharovorans]MBS7704388.1 hypothetical protein [Chelatococcus asaccharovorans]PXW55733.1 hypothetical protein C7450_109141 [Chelatococcus asaccharovorans]